MFHLHVLFYVKAMEDQLCQCCDLNYYYFKNKVPTFGGSTHSNLDFSREDKVQQICFLSPCYKLKGKFTSETVYDEEVFVAGGRLNFNLKNSEIQLPFPS